MRYSRGGKSRGLKSEYCEVEWDIDKNMTTVKLDYQGIRTGCKSKYSQWKTNTRSKIEK